MVVADGIIDTRELEVLYRIGKENYGLTPEEISHAVTQAGTSFCMPTLLTDQVRLLYELAIIAWADGVIEDSEKNLLRTYALKMGFKDENVDGIVDFLLAKAKDNKPFKNVMSQIQSN